MNIDKNRKKIDTLISNYRNIFDNYKFSENLLGDKQIKGTILNSIIEKISDKKEIAELLKLQLNGKNYNFYNQLIEILSNYYNNESWFFEFTDDSENLQKLNKEELKIKIRKKLNLEDEEKNDTLNELENAEIDLLNSKINLKIIPIEIFFKNFSEYNEFTIKNNFIQFWELNLANNFNFPLIANLTIILPSSEDTKEIKFKINKLLNESMQDDLEELKIFEIVMFFKDENNNLINKIELFKERMTNNTKKFKIVETTPNLEYELKNKFIEDIETEDTKKTKLKIFAEKVWECFQAINYNNPWLVWFLTAGTPVLLINTSFRIIVWLVAAYFNKKHVDKIKKENGDFYKIQVPKLRESNIFENKVEDLKEKLAEKLIWKERIKNSKE